MVYTPTSEEQAKIQQLKSLLEEHLKTNKSLTPKARLVRLELQKIAQNPEFLFKYIRGRKLNVSRAFETILKYADVKCVIYPHLFPEQVPDYVISSIESKLVRVLSNKDKLGRSYIMIDSTKYDDSVISTEECANVLRYTLEALMSSPDFLDNGVVLLDDATGILFRHGKLAIPAAEFYQIFWRAFPVKLKEVLYFNAPIYGKSLFAMIKPFVKSKLIERGYVSSGLATLHKRVPLDILPQLYGGTVPDELAYVPTEKLLEMVFGK